MKPVKCHISFTANQWICKSKKINILADSLDEMDEKLKNELQKCYNDQEITVKMYFDFDRFPTWMRQYMPHYFNRIVTFEK